MGREHLEDIYVDGRIILNISCINHVGGCGLENCNEPVCSIQGREFLD
jgi:hypothetical protein